MKIFLMPSVWRSCQRLVEIVVLVGDVEVVLVALRAGERRRAGVDRQVELALRDRVRHDRHGEVRPDDAGQHVDLVALDHLVGDLHRQFRLHRVVLGDDLDVLRAGQLERQHEAVARVDAEAGAAAGQRRDHADLDRLGEGGAREAQRHGSQPCSKNGPHCDLPCRFEQDLTVPEDTSG